MAGLGTAAPVTAGVLELTTESMAADAEPNISLEAPIEADPVAAAQSVDAFIPAPAAHPLERQPLAAARDPIVVTADPSRQSAQGRQSSNLLARLGLFNRGKRNRAENASQDKRITPPLRAAGAAGAELEVSERTPAPPVISTEDQLEIPAFLRRTAN
jgi:hypothetical protein